MAREGVRTLEENGFCFIFSDSWKKSPILVFRWSISESFVSFFRNFSVLTLKNQKIWRPRNASTLHFRVPRVMDNPSLVMPLIQVLDNCNWLQKNLAYFVAPKHVHTVLICESGPVCIPNSKRGGAMDPKSKVIFEKNIVFPHYRLPKNDGESRSRCWKDAIWNSACG